MTKLSKWRIVRKKSSLQMDVSFSIVFKVFYSLGGIGLLRLLTTKYTISPPTMAPTRLNTTATAMILVCFSGKNNHTEHWKNELWQSVEDCITGKINRFEMMAICSKFYGNILGCWEWRVHVENMLEVNVGKKQSWKYTCPKFNHGKMLEVTKRSWKYFIIFWTSMV